jgi:hypothetical protein
MILKRQVAMAWALHVGSDNRTPLKTKYIHGVSGKPCMNLPKTSVYILQYWDSYNVDCTWHQNYWDFYSIYVYIYVGIYQYMPRRAYSLSLFSINASQYTHKVQFPANSESDYIRNRWSGYHLQIITITASYFRSYRLLTQMILFNKIIDKDSLVHKYNT